MKSTKNQPTVFVIFGGTGDLNWRKITPALYNLFLDDWLPNQFSIIGTGRTKLSDDDFKSKLLDGINQFSRSGKAKDDKWKTFSYNVFYQSADLNDAETYTEFGNLIKKIRRRLEPGSQCDLLPRCGTTVLPDNCREYF